MEFVPLRTPGGGSFLRSSLVVVVAVALFLFWRAVRRFSRRLSDEKRD